MQLQKSPLGILGWLALKVSGRNPPMFGDTVLPTMDVGDNYLLAGELANETVLGTMGAGAQTSSLMAFNVPSNKLYRVLSIGADIALDAADVAFSTAWACYVTLGSAGGTICYLAASAMFPVGHQNREGVWYFPRPLLLPPGSRMTVFVRTSAATTNPATPHAYIMRQSIDA